MPTRKGLLTVVAGLSCLMALAFAPSAGALTTVRHKGSDDGSGVITTTATCPKGERVIAGGFRANPIASVVENHRTSTRSWTVSVYEVNTATAMAYCSKKLKVVEASAVGTLNDADRHEQQGGATATCPDGTSVASGGFDYQTHVSNSSVYTSRPVGKDGWKIYAASNITGNSITSYAYCLKGKVAHRSSANSYTQTRPSASRGTGHRGGVSDGRTRVVADCTKGEQLVGGGYETTPLPDFYNEVGPDTFFARSARVDHKRWKASAGDFSGFSGGKIRAFVDCLS